MRENEQQQFDTIFIMAELVRVNSEKGKLTSYTAFTEHPVSLPEAEVSGKVEEFKGKEEYQDIQFITGAGQTYLYSNSVMTENYAKLLIRVESGNLLSLIAETVRDESRIYPRTTDIRIFSDTPFNIREEDFLNLLIRMQEEAEYQDIKEVRASNDALYLYSDTYLPNDHAIALTEWVEVIRKEIP